MDRWEEGMGGEGEGRVARKRNGWVGRGMDRQVERVMDWWAEIWVDRKKGKDGWRDE